MDRSSLLYFYHISYTGQKLLVGLPERKLLCESIDVKIERYIVVIEKQWPLPKTYWFTGKF